MRRCPAEGTPSYVTFRFRSDGLTDPDDPLPSVFGAALGLGNPIYDANTKADFGMEFEWEGEAPFVGYAELEVVHSLGQPHFYERVDLTGRGPGKISAKFSPKFSIPGVSEVWMRLVDGQGSMLWNDRYRMAYALEDFQPDVRVEPDFKTFWDETLAEMRKLPLNPTTERVEKYKDFPGFEVYEVSFDGRMGRRIYAVMYVPRDAPRPLPVMVTAHPGIRGFGINKGPDGLFGSQFRPDSRFLTIVPLIRGHRPDAEDIPFSPPWWGPMESREEYVARDWYAALVRTNDYLASRPDLADMTRIVVAGGSQGGAFAIVTAALDPRVAYCFADCPAMGLPHEMMKHYMSYGPSRGQAPPGIEVEELERLLSYYDPVNFAPYITCPTHVGSNIGDITVHSMGPLAIYKNLTGLKSDQKAFHAGFTHMHGSGFGLAENQKQILDGLASSPP